MLKGLKRPLKTGDTVTVVLTTDGGIEMEVQAVVRKLDL